MGIVTGQWHPLLKLPGGSWVGFVRPKYENFWLGSYDEAKRQLDLGRPVGLLPLLDQPLSVVEAELQELSDRGYESFSTCIRACLGRVAEVAIKMESSYWTERAIDWIDARGPQDSSDSQLDLIVHSSWASQPIRHKALRLLNRRRRNAQ